MPTTESRNRPDAGQERDIDLINDLRALPNETPWVEFKRDNTNPEMIGKLVSALANSCRLEDRERAYMLWGLDDSTHRVVGSAFDPDGDKVGNQGLAIWLDQALQSNVAFQFRVVDHPDGRVVILEIPPALLAPVMFKGFQLPPPLFRVGEDSMQVVLYGPRSFAEMTQDERIRACYHHAVLKCLSGDRMKNATLCERFGIDKKNAAMASGVLQKALAAGLIKPADPEHPRAGYVPAWWA
ncbi:MAG: ATP-binding protein [Magnetococcales bacterium]|nr:ATP-binding protein [Magnetococcales bacterium]